MDQLLSYQSDHFELYTLAEGIFIAIAKDGGAAICNAGLIDLGGQVVVFDTFMTPQAALDLSDFSSDVFGQSPQLVINSHYHNDHIWGNQVFASSAQILSSCHTRQLIHTAGADELQWYSAHSVERLDALLAQFQNAQDEEEKRSLQLWIGYYQGLVDAFPHLRVCAPDITFDGSLEIHGTHRLARLITFEGAHTGSDSILFLPQEGIIFMSDLIFVNCHPYLADGDPLGLLKALKEISQLNATRFVPGHGPIGTGEDLRLFIAYVEGCITAAQELVGDDSANQEKFMELKVPLDFEAWQQPQFYRINIEFLWNSMRPAK